jgi:hypothetical protein
LGLRPEEIERNLAQDDEVFFEGNRTSPIFEKKEGQVEIKSLMIKEMNPKLEVRRVQIEIKCFFQRKKQSRIPLKKRLLIKC